MIIFKNNKIETEEPKDIKLDGVYWGIVIETYVLDEMYCSCFIYIPEVYGPDTHVYDTMYNYPRVKVPIKQDADDEGHYPVTGEIVKVSFNDGSSNDCEFISLLPTSTQTITANRDYIKYGTIPSQIIVDIEDPAVLATVKDWLPHAYQVTIGRNSPLANDYICKNLFSNKNFENIFLQPLGLPIASYPLAYFHDDIALPVFTTNIYTAYDVWKNILNTGDKDIYSLFNTPIPENAEKWLSGEFRYTPEDMFDSPQEEIPQFISCMGSGIDWMYNRIAFPQKGEDDNILNNIWRFNTYTWWKMFEPTSKDISTGVYTKNHMGEFLLKHKDLYEKEWIKTIASWRTGVTNLLPGDYQENDKIKEIILLCLTICPWTAIALIRYRDSAAFSLMEQAKGSYYDAYNRVEHTYNVTGPDAYSYVTSVFDDKSFSDFGNNIQKSIRVDLCDKANSDAFIETFKTECYRLFNSVSFASMFSPGIDTWTDCDMNNKFTRLKEIARSLI
nr:hypothetical protein DGKKSRWO_DGKKSRWO_CDS_0010 [uncultured phage]CAI9752114.1 hypothetical protein CVNMHQAP_CVNMHQAP_CDS_0010 [uncultured phage]